MHNKQPKAFGHNVENDSLPVINSKISHDVIDIPNVDNDLSTYSKFFALYSRAPETYSLYNVEEKQASKFSTQWDNFVAILKKTKGYKTSNGIQEYMIPPAYAFNFTGINNLPIKVSEYSKEGEDQIRGAVTSIEHENEFNDWFVSHILDQSRISYNSFPKIVKNDGQDYGKMVTDFFAAELKNSIKEDEWETGNGYEYFLKRVRYYTNRNLKIEAVLPAFPCKSSNMQKVNGCVPDKGEELALRTLLKFTKDVEAFYPPGMRIWIVSDGHVFSDCIGVDDDKVDDFSALLHKLFKGIAPESENIGFVGLKDVFFNGAGASRFNNKWVSEIELKHYCGTKINPDAELCRQILMMGCDTDCGKLKTQIEIPNHPRLHLYRGFSRFMVEDLCLLPFFENASRKYFKRTVCKVAFEMIKRNDAYSNLVELIFPHHLRFSIHAHTNSGPKYGIKVVSPKMCKTIRNLDSDETPTFEDLLHIPTPWHNCVVKINDELYLTKNRVVKDALESGEYQGEWIDSDIPKGEGGYWNIVKI